MHICILIASYEETTSPLKGVDTDYSPEAFLDAKEHTWEKILVHHRTAVQQVEELVASGRFDVYLNLCDGPDDVNRAGVDVVTTLHRLGVAYTGPTPQQYSLTKEVMKTFAARVVPTPPWRFVQTDADVDEAAASLTFPLIVKHHDGFGSMGMTSGSRVNDVDELRVEVHRVVASAGRALVENFVEGDEYSVLVAEGVWPSATGNGVAGAISAAAATGGGAPHSDAAHYEDDDDDDDVIGGGSGHLAPRPPPLVLQPVRFKFPAGETFKHYDIKWSGSDQVGWEPCRDAKVAASLMDNAGRVFEALRGVGYGRCDFRVDSSGTAWLLEINTTCAIFYPPQAPGMEGCADMILAVDSLGPRGFLNHLFVCAIRRRDARLRRQLRLAKQRVEKGDGVIMGNGVRLAESGTVTLETMVVDHYDNAYMMGLLGEIHFDLELSAAEVDMALAVYRRVRSAAPFAVAAPTPIGSAAATTTAADGATGSGGATLGRVYLPCAGTLRHVPRLLEVGAEEIVCIDLSGVSLARGKEEFGLADGLAATSAGGGRALDKGDGRVRIFQADIRNVASLVSDAEFPLVLLLGNSLGDVTDVHGHEQVLAAIGKTLARNGLLVFDYVGDRYLEGLKAGERSSTSWPERLKLHGSSGDPVPVQDKRTRWWEVVSPGIRLLHFECEVLDVAGTVLHKHQYAKLVVEEATLKRQFHAAGMCLHAVGAVADVSEYHRRRIAEINDLGMLGSPNNLYYAERLDADLVGGAA